MSSEKSLAIVLRVVDFSETSVVTTLFTRDFGKISALAKGARRPKGPFEAALDLLAVCRIVFIHKSSDALDLLTEAKLDRRFRAASRNLSRLYAGYYVAELLRELTDLGDPHPDLFGEADRALRELDFGGDVQRTTFRFELAALDLLGHLPSLNRCVGCEESIKMTGRVAFGLLAGGVLCGRCRAGKRQVVSVSCETVRALQELTDRSGEGSEEGSEENREEDGGKTPGGFPSGEARGLLNRYFSHLIGRPLRMPRYLMK